MRAASRPVQKASIVHNHKSASEWDGYPVVSPFQAAMKSAPF
jgi:hypothetical protein